MQIDIEREHIGNKCLIFFFVRLGKRENLFADLSQVVIEGSRGLGRMLERQNEGSRIDFKNLRESCFRRSAKLGMAAQYRA